MANRKGVWSSPNKEGEDDDEDIDALIQKSQMREKELQHIYEKNYQAENAKKDIEYSAKQIKKIEERVLNYKLIKEHPKREYFGKSPEVKASRGDTTVRGDGLHKITRQQKIEGLIDET